MSNQKVVDVQMLQIFVTTAEERNMSAAAKRLGVTQSAISQSIRQLEEQFGVVLLNRERRPLALTPAGLALRNRAVMLLNEMGNLKAQVVDASKGIKPDVRLGLIDSYAATCGTAFIKEMLGRTTSLSVRTGLSPYHGEALVGRELDLVVSTDPLTDIDGIIRRRLLTEQFLVITPPGYVGNARTAKEIRALAQAQPILRFNHQSHLGMQIERFLRRIDVRAPHRLEVDTADTLTSMVAGGIGWAVTTPMCLLQAGDFSTKVTTHFIEGLASGRSVYLVARRDEYSTFFEEAYDVARALVEPTLLAGAKAIRPGLELLIEPEPRIADD